MNFGSSSASPWVPFAPSNSRAQIFSILDDLEVTLSCVDEKAQPGLSGGTAGIALFYGYLSKLSGKATLKDRAVNMLGQAVERVGVSTGAHFYSGYTGIAWAVEHLNREIFTLDEGQEEDSNEGVDEVLLDLLAPSPWQKDYDLISGLVGYGVYALERQCRPSARQLLARILDHLEFLAVNRKAGQSWLTSPELLPPWQREQAPNGYFNLGLAHGVPGILFLLAAIEKIGQTHKEISSLRAGRLLESGMTWQFSQVQDKGAQSYLANWCPSEKDIAHSEGGRVAWCYGDLGASMAILTAARLAKRDDWEIKALDMARQAAARPLNTSGVRDTSLCHGSAGNTLIFQRLFLLTGEECFWQAAQMYLEHLINSRNPGGPFGGYTTYKPETDADSKVKENVNPYKSDPGLLEGAAGAGLVLLAALGVEPKWDRFLLHSLSDGF